MTLPLRDPGMSNLVPIVDRWPARGGATMRPMDSTPEDTLLKCSFCSLDQRWGVCGGTRELFVCDDCIALMVNIRRTELGDDSWPSAE